MFDPALIGNWAEQGSEMVEKVTISKRCETREDFNLLFGGRRGVVTKITTTVLDEDKKILDFCLQIGEVKMNSRDGELQIRDLYKTFPKMKEVKSAITTRIGRNPRAVVDLNRFPSALLRFEKVGSREIPFLVNVEMLIPRIRTDTAWIDVYE